MNEISERELFETLPVHKAVAALAVPTIISQIVTIIYNLADTFFIGQLGNPYMVAAPTLVYPWFGLLTALVIALCFVACFLGFAPWILQAFIRNEQTSSLGTAFLRIACLAVPLQSVNALIIYTLQSMGKGMQSAVLTLCRQGLLNIPLLILMNRIFGLYGMIWTQLIIEVIMIPATSGMYMATWKKLKKSQQGVQT